MKTKQNKIFNQSKKKIIEAEKRELLPAIILVALSLLSVGLLFRIPIPFFTNPHIMRFYVPFSVMQANFENLLHLEGGYARSLWGGIIFLGMSGLFLLMGKIILGFSMFLRKSDLLTIASVIKISVSETIVMAWVLGSLSCSLFALIFGSFGLINGWVAGGLVSVGLFSLLKDWLSLLLKWFGGGFREARKEKISFGLFIFLFVWILSWSVISVVPESFWDSIVTHLAIPNYYVMEGRVKTTPFHIHSYLTQNIEMLVMLSFWLKSEVGAALIHWGFYACLMILIVGWVTRKTTLTIGLISAFIFVASPMSTWVANHVKNDLPMAVFLLCHWLALHEAFNSHEADQTVSKRWFLLSGIFAGGAVGYKLTAIPALLITFVAILVFERKSILVSKLNSSMSFWLLGATVSLCPWLIRNVVIAGNPVYPYLSGLFGNRLLYDWHRPIGQRNSIAALGISGLWSYFQKLSWVFSNTSRDTIWGTILFLGLISFYCLWNRFSRTNRWLFIIGLVSWILSITFSFEARYHVAFLVLLFCIFFGFAIHEIDIKANLKFLKPILLASIGLMFLKNVAYSTIILLMAAATQIFISGCWVGNFTISGGEPTAQYASVNDVRWINYLIDQSTNQKDKILFMGITRTYGSSRPFYGSSDLDKQVIHYVAENSKDVDEMAKSMREMGIKHIVYDPTEWYEGYVKRKEFFGLRESDQKKINEFIAKYARVHFTTNNKKLIWYRLVDDPSKIDNDVGHIALKEDDIKKFPFDALKFGMIQLESGNKSTAKEIFETIVNLKTIPYAISTGYKSLLEIASRERDNEKILFYSKKCIESDPYNADPFLCMALTEWQFSRDKDKTIYWINRAIINDPDATARSPIFFFLKKNLAF